MIVIDDRISAKDNGKIINNTNVTTQEKKFARRGRIIIKLRPITSTRCYKGVEERGRGRGRLKSRDQIIIR